MKDKIIGGFLFLVGAVFGLAGVLKLVGHLTAMGDAPLEGAAAASQLAGVLIGFALVVVAYYAFRGGKRRIFPPAKPQGTQT
jgi:hypothetical protein